MSQSLRFRTLTTDDAAAAVELINVAAGWYREFLPPEELVGPEMSLDDWLDEGRRMTWYGAFAGDELRGVMGLEYVDDVALFRHAYVVPAHQQQGVASQLHAYVEGRVENVDRIVVGTYAANYKARRALEKGGYRLSPDSVAVLRAYYEIPEDRLRSSVTYEKAVAT